VFTLSIKRKQIEIEHWRGLALIFVSKKSATVVEFAK
jgi:hypothetical protein